ncbi:B-cell receptor-associated protein 31-like-domain-containing protein [Gilbertella persicaria]|uniref:B-cell receptor-associated protein 31-like-domain-containing protein n=1 Tax=Gilbertella persicaria TaxID=101096 RepID=UPI00221F6230|nr:B-cell receptor-associated protein 31-like-domain-containing protein [Gilbertella persicaria]KAI8087944.1 B-cell receptor-associated protein 31-like-domain-containing protein [Gilbertella persicaria]
MTLYYSIVFAILAVEIFIFFLFLLPIPTRWQKPVFRWLATSPMVAHAQYVMRIVFVFIFVLFLDAVNTLRAFYDVVSEEENGIPPAGNTDFRAQVGQAAKKFYAQRNLYLTGFTILLLLILNKIKNMSLDYIQLEDQYIQLEGSVSTDPAVRKATREMDTEPIDTKVTKLVPAEKPKHEDKKTI